MRLGLVEIGCGFHSLWLSCLAKIIGYRCDRSFLEFLAASAASSTAPSAATSASAAFIGTLALEGPLGFELGCFFALLTGFCILALVRRK